MQHNELISELFRDNYWGILGCYRDLTRQLKYLKSMGEEIHPICLEDIEVCRSKLGRVIILAQSLDQHMIPDHTKAELKKVKREGLNQWAQNYVDNEY